MATVTATATGTAMAITTLLATSAAAIFEKRERAKLFENS